MEEFWMFAVASLKFLKFSAPLGLKFVKSESDSPLSESKQEEMIAASSDSSLLLWLLLLLLLFGLGRIGKISFNLRVVPAA